MLEELTKTLTGSQYVNADSYAIQEDIIQNYKQHGAQSVSLITQALFFCISLWFLLHFVSQVFRMSETHAATLWEPMGALSNAQLFAGIEQVMFSGIRSIWLKQQTLSWQSTCCDGDLKVHANNEHSKTLKYLTCPYRYCENSEKSSPKYISRKHDAIHALLSFINLIERNVHRFILWTE